MSKQRPQRSVPPLYTEDRRPQLHFSSPRHWINDPNGLVWHKGLFHLFYQHNPGGHDWGNMHWGHAVSADLVHWQQRPIAIHADPWGTGFAFSGSAVVDHDNRSGLGNNAQPPMVAIYTGASVEGVQTQCVAFSVDDGDTWTPYVGNPVIANPGIRDFRDPDVFWDTQRERWVMLLAARDRIIFYVSNNLLEWRRVSDFHCPLVHANDILECPDLFPLADAGGKQHWVLIVSETNDVTQKDRATRYFIGSFDGQQFTPYDKRHRWLDDGPDNYASVTWDNLPASDGRRVSIGWMTNWRYAREAPTYPWRGHMTLPRELSLIEGAAGYRLATYPAREIKTLRQSTARLDKHRADSHQVATFFSSLNGDLLDLDLEYAWGDSIPEAFGLQFSNTEGEVASIVIDVAGKTLTVDRTQIGLRRQSGPGLDRCTASLPDIGRQLDLRLIKDRNCVEVFADRGRRVVSANLFSDAPLTRVAMFGGGATVRGEASPLTSIWKGRHPDGSTVEISDV